jgi:hypothetical protein
MCIVGVEPYFPYLFPRLKSIEIYYIYIYIYVPLTKIFIYLSLDLYFDNLDTNLNICCVILHIQARGGSLPQTF